MNWYVIEDTFEHKGYKCVCIFNKMGFRCGYVGVDENHLYYGKNYYDDGINEIDCHFGLTYSGDGSNFGSTDALWYFGFDCGHFCDIPDFDLALKYGLIDEKHHMLSKSLEDIYKTDEKNSVKDVDFVKENCKMIVEQLILAKNKGD